MGKIGIEKIIIFKQSQNPNIRNQTDDEYEFFIWPMRFFKINPCDVVNDNG